MFQKSISPRPHLLFERIMAIIAAINLTLVVFDLSYIPWRDFYLRNMPVLTEVYDPIKGVERHRATQTYLREARTLAAQVDQTGLNSPEVSRQLEVLREESFDLIDTNPFVAANKTGTLEKIKNRMRDRVNQASAKQAFAEFWSVNHLTQQGWRQEYNFYEQEIEPLIATNYYRQIGENGEAIDWFWLIDLPFVIVFGIELIFRSYFIRKKYSFSWLEAFLWRWYDWFLLLPFFRWLRIIPVTIRLDKARLINLYPLRKLIHQGVVANFAEELTEIVVVRVINQIQTSVQRGELTRWLIHQNKDNYIDINQVNEIEAIAKIFIQAIVYQVLPQIQPELIAIFQHNINNAFQTSPVYRNLQNIPGISNFQTQINEQLATQIANNLYQALVNSVEDPVSGQLVNQLIERFTGTLGQEMQKKQITSELQNLIFEFLEEVKINYVQRLGQEDIELIIEQARKLRTQNTVATTITSNRSNLVHKN